MYDDFQVFLTGLGSETTAPSPVAPKESKGALLYIII